MSSDTRERWFQLFARRYGCANYVAVPRVDVCRGVRNTKRNRNLLAGSGNIYLGDYLGRLILNGYVLQLHIDHSIRRQGIALHIGDRAGDRGRRLALPLKAPLKPTPVLVKPLPQRDKDGRLPISGLALRAGTSKGCYTSKDLLEGKDITMLHSTVTSKGQTTIPEKIRKALRIKPGDKLEYEVEGDRATIRVHPGIRSLKGALASNKGKGMSFAEIREAAAEAARHEGSR
jgi:antitoxin PrlF